MRFGVSAAAAAIMIATFAGQEAQADPSRIVQTFQVKSGIDAVSPTITVKGFDRSLGRLLNVYQVSSASLSYSEIFRAYGPYVNVGLASQATSLVQSVDPNGEAIGDYLGGSTNLSGFSIYQPGDITISTAGFTEFFLPAAQFAEQELTEYRLKGLLEWSGQAYLNTALHYDAGPIPPYDYYYVPGEVTFDVWIAYDYAPVPEPATWAMMIGGFGVVGGSLRRRATPRMKAALA